MEETAIPGSEVAPSPHVTTRASEPGIAYRTKTETDAEGIPRTEGRQAGGGGYIYCLFGGHMERVVNKPASHEQAHLWDVRQHLSMTPQERMRAARELKDRAYPGAKDVRECHRSE